MAVSGRRPGFLGSLCKLKGYPHVMHCFNHFQGILINSVRIPINWSPQHTKKGGGIHVSVGIGGGGILIVVYHGTVIQGKVFIWNGVII